MKLYYDVGQLKDTVGFLAKLRINTSSEEDFSDHLESIIGEPFVTTAALTDENGKEVFVGYGGLIGSVGFTPTKQICLGMMDGNMICIMD